MSLLGIAVIVVAVYAVVGTVTYALMKTASDADDIMEAWLEGEEES